MLKAAFSGGMKETESAKLEIKDAEPGAVEDMLRYIYTATLPKKEDTTPLLERAVRFELPQLCDDVTAAMLERLAPGNVRQRTA